MPVERAQPECEQTPGLGATVACVTGSSGAYWERPVKRVRKDPGGGSSLSMTGGAASSPSAAQVAADAGSEELPRKVASEDAAVTRGLMSPTCAAHDAADSASGEKSLSGGVSEDTAAGDEMSPGNTKSAMLLSTGGTDYEVVLRFFDVFSFQLRETYQVINLGGRDHLGGRVGVQVWVNMTVGQFIDMLHSLSVTPFVFTAGSAGRMLTTMRHSEKKSQFVYRLYTGKCNLERTDRAKLLSQCLTDRSEIILLAGMSSTGATAARRAAAQAQQ